MTGKERVIKAINHEEPDRVPFDLSGTLVTGIYWKAYERLRDYLGLEKKETKLFDRVQGLAVVEDDMLERLNVDTRGVLTGSHFGWKLKLEETEEYEQFTDVWGITWRRPKPHGLYYDIVHNPLKGKTLDEIKKYHWPDPKDEHRLAGLKDEAARLAKSESLVLLGGTGMTAGLLQTYQWLLGYEESFYALAGDPGLAHHIIGKLAELDIEFWEWAIPYLGDDIKVVLYADDFGLQNGPVFSHKMFEQYFKPWYAKIFSTIKKNNPNLYTFFHSCGATRFIIPDLIELGIDILNPIQVSAKGMDTTSLKKDFGKDITFWGGGVDTQRVLPRGTHQEVRDEVKKRIADLAPGGGFVFNTVHNIQADVPPENIMAMWETLQEFGKY